MCFKYFRTHQVGRYSLGKGLQAGGVDGAAHVDVDGRGVARGGRHAGDASRLVGSRRRLRGRGRGRVAGGCGRHAGRQQPANMEANMESNMESGGETPLLVRSS